MDLGEMWNLTLLLIQVQLSTEQSDESSGRPPLLDRTSIFVRHLVEILSWIRTSSLLLSVKVKLLSEKKYKNVSISYSGVWGTPSDIRAVPERKHFPPRKSPLSLHKCIGGWHPGLLRQCIGKKGIAWCIGCRSRPEEESTLHRSLQKHIGAVALLNASKSDNFYNHEFRWK